MRRIAIALALLSVLIACQKKEEPATETVEAAPPPPTTTTAAATTTAPQAVVHIPADVPIPKDGVALWLNADNIVRIPAEWGPNAPTPMPNVLNGHAVLRFDGQDDMIRTEADIHPGRTPNATVFAVFNSATAEPSPLRKLYGNDDGGFDRAAGLDDRAADANYAFFAGGSGVIAYFPLKAGQFYITADQFTGTGFSGWVDGAKTTSTMAEWGPDAHPNLYVGNTGTTFSEFWQGDLAEMIVYVRALSDAERVQVEDYLAGKYGLTLKRQ